MKKVLTSAVKWMTVLGNVCILIGFFCPFVKSRFYSEWDTYGLFLSVFGDDGNDRMKIAFVILGISVIISFVALSSFKATTELAASIVMLVDVFVGKFCFDRIEEEILSSLQSSIFYTVEKDIGAFLLEKSYVVLIIAAFLALGIGIISRCMSENVKGKFQAMIVPMGQEVYTCPRCGKSYTEKSEYCGACGFAMGRFKCPECGTDRDAKANYCKKCGKRLPVITVDSAGCGEENADEIFGDSPAEIHWICAKCGEENTDEIFGDNPEEMNWVCARCGEENTEEITVDSSVELDWICARCGEKNVKNSKFCRKCGFVFV